MAMGRVSLPDLLRKLVAPNSPRDTAAAKPAPVASGRRNAGSVVAAHARTGGAPSVAAAWRCSIEIERITPSELRTTKGVATKA